MAFLKTIVACPAISLYYEARGGEDASPKDFPEESALLYEWIVGEEKCRDLEKIIFDRFPYGADRQQYYKFFRDEWETIAEKVGCPKEEISKTHA